MGWALCYGDSQIDAAMILRRTALPGLIEVEAMPHRDTRGSFVRAFCADVFREAGIDFLPVQTSLSTNTAPYTLRGLHFQHPPHAEAKLVRVVSGRAFDVAVDLRPGATYGQWCGFELTASRMNAVYIPKGFAHGFLTLEPETALLYQISPAYGPGHGKGIRWDDPTLSIIWPEVPRVISESDRDLPTLSECK